MRPTPSRTSDHAKFAMASARAGILAAPSPKTTTGGRASATPTRTTARSWLQPMTATATTTARPLPPPGRRPRLRSKSKNCPASKPSRKSVMPWPRPWKNSWPVVARCRRSNPTWLPTRRRSRTASTAAAPSEAGPRRKARLGGLFHGRGKSDVKSGAKPVLQGEWRLPLSATWPSAPVPRAVPAGW